MRYAPFTPLQTIKCEWCGRRAPEEGAYMAEGMGMASDGSLLCYDRLNLCFCSERCLDHAPSLAEAIICATKGRAQWTYIASRHTLPK